MRVSSAVSRCAVSRCGALLCGALLWGALVGLSGAAAHGAPPILVLRPDGVQQLDVRGQVLRTWSPRPARWAHRLADGGLVVDAGPAGLERVSSPGAVTSLAFLPPAQGCGFGPAGPGVETELGLRAPWDAQISADGRWLCVALEDQGGQVRARYEVELETGAVDAVVARAPGCPPQPGPASRCDWAGPVAPAPPLQAWPYRWDVAGARLAGPAEASPLDFCQGRLAARCARPVSVAVSASGRWRLLRLPAGPDQTHPLFALDHQSGALFALQDGAWPRPLDPTERARLVRDPQAVASLKVAPTVAVFAIEPGDRFGVGARLVTPGQRVQVVGPLVP